MERVQEVALWETRLSSIQWGVPEGRGIQQKQVPCKAQTYRFCTNKIIVKINLFSERWPPIEPLLPLKWILEIGGANQFRRGNPTVTEACGA